MAEEVNIKSNKEADNSSAEEVVSNSQGDDKEKEQENLEEEIAINEIADDGKENMPSLASLSEEEFKELLNKVEERDIYLNELLRIKAEFDNYQKRIKRERPSLEKQAVRRVILEILPIQDSFERALDEKTSCDSDSNQKIFRDGIVMIQQMINQFLENNGTKEIDALDQSFDPQLHHAVHQLPMEDKEKDGIVMEVVQKGYTHDNTVIRPSRVVVGKKTSSEGEKTEEGSEDSEK